MKLESMFTDQDMRAIWLRFPPYILTYGIIHRQIHTLPLLGIASEILVVFVLMMILFLNYRKSNSRRETYE